jgi:hypothetical protein
MPTDALAERALSDSSMPVVDACIGRHADRLGVEREATSEALPIKTTFLAVQRTLGPGAFGFHAVATFPKAPEDGRVYFDGFLFRVGAALVSFSTLSVARAFPPATERRLLSLLYNRAKAHKL